MMASDEKNPIHEQHIYDYFTVTEKFVRTAVPQPFMDCMTQFEERLIVEFETYLNGQKIHHDDIAKGIFSQNPDALPCVRFAHKILTGYIIFAPKVQYYYILKSQAGG